MDSKRALITHPRQRAAQSAVAGIFACGLILMSALAAAQERAGSRPSPDPGYLGTISRWLDQQVDNIGTTFKNVSQKLGKFGRDAGDMARTTVDGAKDAANTVARTTVDGAKDAADAVARIPNARVVIGREKCKDAPNGAPDCVAAANAVCKAKGFDSGKSVDMTTAEVCPAQAWLSGRVGKGECRTETFVSRALCQ